ncbi:MAG TPA: hypothetical protein VER39_11355, partial [Nocardioidaceae bacterium]|nr:hypothetical protein [Nocardioidaceae bacterium]
ALPVSEDNPYGLALVQRSRPLLTESEGRQDVDWASHAAGRGRRHRWAAHTRQAAASATVPAAGHPAGPAGTTSACSAAHPAAAPAADRASSRGSAAAPSGCAVGPGLAPSRGSPRACER